MENQLYKEDISLSTLILSDRNLNGVLGADTDYFYSLRWYINTFDNYLESYWHRASRYINDPYHVSNITSESDIWNTEDMITM